MEKQYNSNFERINIGMIIFKKGRKTCMGLIFGIQHLFTNERPEL